MAAVEDIDLERLHPPGFHGSVGAYLGQVWDRRQYLWHVPRSELRGQQSNTVLGNLWHLLNPVLSIAVYYVIFGLVLRTDRGVDNFIVFLSVGVFLFQFTQRSTVEGSKSLVRNRGLMRTLSFPRALLPLSAVITQAMMAAPTLLVIWAVAAMTGERPSPSWLLLPLVVAWQTLLNIGLACIAARANHAFGDVQNLLPYLFRLLFYGSGVLFLVDAYLTSHPQARWIFYVNPLYGFIEMGRWTVLGTSVRPVVVATTAAWSAIALVGGFAWFRRQETSYGS